MAKKFVICINNKGYKVSLEKGKVYQIVPDKEAETHKQIRVVDESNQDYLYPVEYFAPIDLPRTIEKALIEAT